MVEDLVPLGIFAVLAFVATFAIIVTVKQRNKVIHPPPTSEELTDKYQEELRKIDKYIDSIGG